MSTETIEEQDVSFANPWRTHVELPEKQSVYEFDPDANATEIAARRREIALKVRQTLGYIAESGRDSEQDGNLIDQNLVDEATPPRTQ